MNPQNQANPNTAEPANLLHPAPVNVAPFTSALSELLTRTKIKGNEVPMYTEVWNVVQAIKEGELLIITTQQAGAARSFEQQVEVLTEQNAKLADSQLARAFREDPKVKAAVQAFYADKSKPAHAGPDDDQADAPQPI